MSSIEEDGRGLASRAIERIKTAASPAEPKETRPSNVGPRLGDQRGCALCRQAVSIKYGGGRVSQRGSFLLRPLSSSFVPAHSYGFFLRILFVMAAHFDRRTDSKRVLSAHARRGANFLRTVSATPTAGTVGIETAPPIATRDNSNQLTKGEKAGVIIGVVLFFAIIGV